jgi:DNA-directed RNA polymerase subunit RPC12/RpoP
MPFFLDSKNIVMTNYRYFLDTSSKKFNCPQCSKKRFVRYKDSKSGNYAKDSFGRCDREQNCGYHLLPKMDSSIINQVPFKVVTKPEISFVDNSLASSTFQRFEDNYFVRFLIKSFGKEVALNLSKKYHIGTSKKWNGATIFWQKDYFGRYRTGKIMLYNEPPGRRLKKIFPTWVHAELKAKGIIKDFHLEQCLFGEHLLKDDASKKVAVVESEKTAIVMSVFLPEFIWLATGGSMNLKRDKFLSMRDRTVVLFPDLGQFENWEKEAKKILNCKVVVSDLLEKKATSEEKKQGYDLADFFLKKEDVNGLILSEYGYPQFWDY